FLEDEDFHQLAGKDDRLERVGELVDVQDRDAAQLRNFVQVEVVRDDLPLQRPRKLDQLQIHFFDVGEIGVRDRDLHAGHLLNLLQDVEAAPSAIALHRVRRV